MRDSNLKSLIELYSIIYWNQLFIEINYYFYSIIFYVLLFFCKYHVIFISLLKKIKLAFS